MIIFGLAFLIIGYILNIPILVTVGMVLVIMGLVFIIIGAVGDGIGGRRHWY